MTIRRAFADLPHGQVHYRDAGAGPPLLLLHASPGSGRQLAPLIADLAATRRIVAPDTPGNGDSVALATAAPVIADYAAAALDLLDVLGLARVDVYGSHTGASIAAELAVRAPDRVGRVVLDGIGVFRAEQRADLLEHYAHPFVPDLDGAYLIRAWHFLRDQYLFFPWFDRRRAARRDTSLPRAADLAAWLVEVLKAGTTYHFAYRAAFAWDAAAVLPQVCQPTLVLASTDDPLFAGTQSVAALLPTGRFAELPRYDDARFAATRRDLIVDFLG